MKRLYEKMKPAYAATLLIQRVDEILKKNKNVYGRAFTAELFGSKAFTKYLDSDDEKQQAFYFIISEHYGSYASGVFGYAAYLAKENKDGKN